MILRAGFPATTSLNKTFYLVEIKTLILSFVFSSSVSFRALNQFEMKIENYYLPDQRSQIDNSVQRYSGKINVDCYQTCR